VKITTLPIAIVMTLLIRDRMAVRAGAHVTSTTRMVGIASIALWVVVAAAGRWIGFS
jgi:hypothetical protein